MPANWNWLTGSSQEHHQQKFAVSDPRGGGRRPHLLHQLPGVVAESARKLPSALATVATAAPLELELELMRV